MTNHPAVQLATSEDAEVAADQLETLLPQDPVEAARCLAAFLRRRPDIGEHITLLVDEGDLHTSVRTGLGREIAYIHPRWDKGVGRWADTRHETLYESEKEVLGHALRARDAHALLYARPPDAALWTESEYGISAASRRLYGGRLHLHLSRPASIFMLHSEWRSEMSQIPRRFRMASFSRGVTLREAQAITDLHVATFQDKDYAELFDWCRTNHGELA